MINPAPKTMGVAYLALTTLLAAARADEKLATDPRLLTGKLDNGLAWIYRQHDNPPGRMAMLLHVASGSLNETDAQRGLAHFIEHMAFNGSENFPPGTLLNYFESIGMQFGDDLNAFTGFDQTAYLLLLPDAKPEEIEKGLKVLSDCAFRLTLPAAEVDKERGVILEELRAGKSAEQRMRDELFPRLFAGSRFGQRVVIGKEEILKTAARAELENYYRTWYRPEYMTLVLVGDAALDAVRPLVDKWFAPFRPTTPPTAPLSPEFKPFSQARALVAKDREYASGQISILRLGTGRPPVTTLETQRTELVEALGSWIVERRLTELLRKGEAAFQTVAVSIDAFYREGVLSNASATGKPEDWEKMLGQLVAELTRVRDHGFTRRELELAQREFTSKAERAVKTESTRNAEEILFQIADGITSGNTLQSAQQELDVLSRLLPTIKLEDLRAAFAASFPPAALTFVLQMPDKSDVKVPTEDELLAAARAALARTVEPPRDTGPLPDLLATPPVPGIVAESSRDEDLGITNLWLDNGVRVHHRYMDYKKDTVLVTITLAGGQIEETADNAGISAVATLAINQPATQRLSGSEITDLMTGKNVQLGAGLGDDVFVVQVSGSPNDLPTGLELAHALLTAPKIEEATFRNWKERAMQRLEAAQSRPDFKALEALRDLVTAGDPRLTLPTPQRLERLTLSAAQAWLERLCQQAPIEVAIVGDLKLEDAQPLIEKYLGSLPKRPRLAAHLDALRKLQRPAGPWERRVPVSTVTPEALFFFGFIGCQASAIDDARLLQLAVNVADSRLIRRIREELGLVYSPEVANEPGMAYEDSGMVMAYAPCDPAHIDEVMRETEAVFRGLADSGPVAEELENARKQILNNLDTEMKEPSYWLNILQSLDFHKLDLNRLKTIRADFAGYTAERVRDTVRKYFTPARTFRVAAIPQAPTTTTTAPATAPAREPAPASP